MPTGCCRNTNLGFVPDRHVETDVNVVAAGSAAAQRARGAAGSRLQHMTNASTAAKQSPAAAAPSAEETAVRQAALASLHKPQEGSSDDPASPRQANAAPILRLRPTVQQVALLHQHPLVHCTSSPQMESLDRFCALLTACISSKHDQLCQALPRAQRDRECCRPHACESSLLSLGCHLLMEQVVSQTALRAACTLSLHTVCTHHHS